MSLINQGTPKGVSWLITVIDNDKNRSAESIVHNFRAQSKVPIRYVCEKNRGIPFARNRALDESLKLSADYIAFVDDDEQASFDWLGKLYTYLCSYSDCVVIHGRVIPKFPEDTPQYMREIFYTKKERPTGTRLQTCATNNVILPTCIINEFNFRFDVSEPLAGGTDTKFFFEANQQGVPIYECAEAIVYETVPKSRLKMSWMMHRKYRSGITIAWRRIKSGHSKLGLILKTVCSVLFHVVLSCLLTIFFQRVRRNKQLLKAARYAGILTGVFGWKTDSYRVVDG